MGQYKTKTFTYENAVVNVHIPVLEEAERQRRMHRLMQGTARFMKEVQKCERENTKTSF